MGVYLSGKSGDFRFNNANWREVLKLAYDYGWEPAGTEAGQWFDETGRLIEQISPDPEMWNGGYFTHDWQWVTDEGTSKIADALERACNAEEAAVDD
jgi:hypothetical protein